MKKIISIFLTLVLLAVCSLPLSAVVHDYGIFVGQTAVTPNNASDVLGDGTVSYDNETKTLTLNNANLTEYSTTTLMDTPLHCGIRSTVDGLTINLVGENRIHTLNEYDDDDATAIYSTGTLNFSGTGSLDARSWSGIMTINDIFIKDCSLSFSTLGICSMMGDLTVDGATLRAAFSLINISSGDITLKNTTVVEGGIGSTCYTETGDLTIEDSNITASAAQDMILVTGEGRGTITIKNSVLDLASQNICIMSWGDVILDGAQGELRAIGEVGYGIDAVGNVEVKDSLLDFVCSASEDFACAIATEKSVTVTDSKLSAIIQANHESALGIGNMIGLGDAVFERSELDLSVSGPIAVGLAGANVKLTDSKARISASADVEGDGFGAGVFARNGSVTVRGGSLNAAAIGPTEVANITAAIQVLNLNTVQIIDADVKLQGNQAISHYPDLLHYEKEHEIAASPETNGSYLIDFNQENIEIIRFLHIIPLYTVTFDGNGGEGEMFEPNGIYGEYTLPENGYTAPEGMRFKGWALSADGDILEGTSYTLSSDITLYAIWEEIPHEHLFEATWTTDANDHWNKCSCGEVKNKGAHTDANTDGACDACAYQMPVPTPPPVPENPEPPVTPEAPEPPVTPEAPAVHTHSFEGEWKQSAEGHHKECSCGEKRYEGTHNDANANGSCDLCGYVLSVVEEDGLGVGAIVGITVGSVAVVGIGSFSLIWFVIKKKSFSDLLAIFRKK